MMGLSRMDGSDALDAVAIDALVALYHSIEIPGTVEKFQVSQHGAGYGDRVCQIPRLRQRLYFDR